MFLMKKIVKAILEALFIYGLICWGYVVLIQVTHPSWIYNRVVWWFPLRLDYFGEISFLISFVSYILLKLK